MDIKDIKKLTAKIEMRFTFDVLLSEKDVKTLKDWLYICGNTDVDDEILKDAIWFLYSEGTINLLNKKPKLDGFDIYEILECKVNK